jgi:hypothetical protein
LTRRAARRCDSSKVESKKEVLTTAIRECARGEIGQLGCGPRKACTQFLEEPAQRGCLSTCDLRSRFAVTPTHDQCRGDGDGSGYVLATGPATPLVRAAVEHRFHSYTLFDEQHAAAAPAELVTA